MAINGGSSTADATIGLSEPAATSQPDNNVEDITRIIYPPSPPRSYERGATTARVQDLPQTAYSNTIVTPAENGIPTPNKTTNVDGRGMWRSWNRVFAKPESACLDLLDNCFDAAFKPDFRGRVVMESYLHETVLIQNNSQSPIKPLEAALTVYKSSKNATSQQEENYVDKESIGENGVGLKQGSATLSNCSIVLTRNNCTLEIGVIAKGLQTSQGVYLPSFAFNVHDFRDTDDVYARIEKWLSQNPDIRNVLAESLSCSSSNPDTVEMQILRFAERLWKDPWSDDDHVFLLVLCNWKRNKEEVPHQLIESVYPAEAFLQDIKKILPEYYINLPTNESFEFTIDKKPMDFSHWQRRLVELTQFVVHIPTEAVFEDDPEDENWDQPAPGRYPLTIYCGFDAKRVHDDVLRKRVSACNLFIYSCQAGRLIKKEDDARHMLGLGASGVDYAQGLTVIINDVAGKLPLTPTKDGIAWSERRNGDVHQNNLIAWTGAVAHFFWGYHRNQIGGNSGKSVKETMKKTILSFAKENLIDATVSSNLQDASLTKFEGITWRRCPPSYDNRWKIRYKVGKRPTKITGPDTLLNMSKDRICLKKPKPTRNTDAVASACSYREELVDDEDDDEEWESIPWAEVDRRDVQLVSKGVLSFLRKKDKESIFEIPVLELMPEISEKYFEVVSQPMDFQTIEQKRIPSYTSIKQLQQDLILVFQNCIAFNGAASSYGKTARKMLRSLDDAFESMDIRHVTTEVLAYLRRADEQELFEYPVIQQNPELKDAYLSAVSVPMDFSTIDEQRIDTYSSMADLKEDLRLIFCNCITFNGPESPFGKIAHHMLNLLDHAFEDVVTGKRRRKRINYNDLLNPRNEEEDENKSDKATASSNVSAVKKKLKIPYNTLEKKVRETEQQLAAERTNVQNLQDRIKNLEEMLVSRTLENYRLKDQLEESQQLSIPAAINSGNCGCDRDRDSMQYFFGFNEPVSLKKDSLEYRLREQRTGFTAAAGSGSGDGGGGRGGRQSKDDTPVTFGPRRDIILDAVYVRHGSRWVLES